MKKPHVNWNNTSRKAEEIKPEDGDRIMEAGE